MHKNEKKNSKGEVKKNVYVNDHKNNGDSYRKACTMTIIIVIGVISLFSICAIMHFCCSKGVVYEKGIESTLMATGLSIIGLAVAVWSGLNIANAIQKKEIEELKKESQEIQRAINSISMKPAFLQEMLKTSRDAFTESYYDKFIDISDKNDENIIKCNRQICAFWNSTVPANLQVPIEMWFSPETISSRHRWILYSYYNTDANKAQECFNTYYDMLLRISNDNVIELSLTIRLLCFSLIQNKDTDISDMELVNLQTDNAECVKYSLNHFFNNYDNLAEQCCSTQDLNKMISFDDATLRKKVAACMKNVDQNELERQISKPHGALEISDLDVKFFEDGELKYLCMPFKTGLEITSPTMSESYMYQLLKPFSHFGSQCLVVLITAKKCSQGLETYIQRMSIREPSWRIEVIQNMQLCKLLKANSQI